MLKRHQARTENGFTIVELMIALTVLSTILLISTTVFIQIGRLYTKGINSADLQNAARTVVTDLSSSVQLSGSQPPGCAAGDTACGCTPATFYVNKAPSQVDSGVTLNEVYAFCVGKIRYTYVLNRELGDDSAAPPALAHTRDPVGDQTELW